MPEPSANRPLGPAAHPPAGKGGRIAIPLLLSLVIPGLGQLYNGEKLKGASILAGVVAIVVTQLGAMLLFGLAGAALAGTVCTVLLAVLGVAAAADAGYRASGRG